MKALLIIFSQFAVLANIVNFIPEKGSVEVLAKGKPALISIKAVGRGIEGFARFEKGVLNAKVSFDLSTLESGIELRDEHMKEKYLEVSKFKDATLVIIDLMIPKLEGEFEFVGILNFHGVSNKIVGSVDIDKSSLNAFFEISLKEFNIEVPSHLGITVSDKIKIAISSQISR